MEVPESIKSDGVHRIECKGSPDGDFWHEVELGFAIPNEMRGPHPITGNMTTYDIVDGVGIYRKEEKK